VAGTELDLRAGTVVARAALCDDLHVGPSVLIVDDHAAFRASARRALEQDGFHVVGEAADGRSGIALARDLEPELVLLDVALPDLSGFDVAERLASTRSKVVLISSREPADFGPRLHESAVLGFISKDRLSAAELRALWELA